MAATPKKSAKQKKPAAVTAPLFERVRAILESARANVSRTVNSTQVLANWLIGREIVEDEQQGKNRASYGASVLVELSDRLGHQYGRGYSVDNLEAFRQFYLEYPLLISETPSRKSNRPPISETVSRKFIVEESIDPWRTGVLNPNLSWSHYRSLLRVTRKSARAFYEIEAINNGWSVRELYRQIGSLLYDRLAKSRDKKGLMRLARQGQEVARPIDMLKDPVVLEFLDLPETPRLVESKLEAALIGNLQKFLLELGKGFAFVSRQERITLDGDHFSNPCRN
jgi:predicted nuclease of restriction endonuclease-like (RecB) superfamily